MGRGGGGVLGGGLGERWEELTCQRRVVDLNKILGMIFLQWFPVKEKKKKREEEREKID